MKKKWFAKKMVSPSASKRETTTTHRFRFGFADRDGLALSGCLSLIAAAGATAVSLMAASEGSLIPTAK
jgi:hypothetical protein